MANYQVMEGKRSTTKVYVHELYRYVMHGVYTNHTRLRCAQYKSLFCPAAAVIKDDHLTLLKYHTHDNDERDINIMKMRKQLKVYKYINFLFF